MITVSEIKEKKALSKRVGRQITLPKRVWNQLDQIASAKGFNVVDLLEYGADYVISNIEPLGTRAEDVQEPCQTAGV